jgi:hypothetical protein
MWLADVGARMSDAKRLLSLHNATTRVGKVLFGEEWIGGLTSREIWLIERYVTGTRSSVAPGNMTYSWGGRKWVEFPISPGLREEVELARDRQEYLKSRYKELKGQLTHVCKWLTEHGFNVNDDTISGEALEQALAGFQGSNTKQPQQRVAAERTCKSWLAAQMSASPKRRPQRKALYREQAKAKFQGLTDRGFDRAWHDAIKETPDAAGAWTKHGPTASLKLRLPH